MTQKKGGSREVRDEMLIREQMDILIALVGSRFG